MKKSNRLFLLVAFLGLFASGCSGEKVSYKEQGWVATEVVDKEKTAATTNVRYDDILEKKTYESIPAKYEVTLKYNDTRYKINTKPSIYEQLSVGDIVKSNYIVSYDESDNFISDTMSFELLPSRHN